MPPSAQRLQVRHQGSSTIAMCAVAVVLGAPVYAAAEVRVFTDRDHPIQAPAGVPVIELDAAAHIESALAADLPSEPARAAVIVQQRLKDGGAALQRRLADAYQNVVDAWSLSVTKIPAVVVDQRYVVYGETDVTRALALIEAYRRTEP